MRTKPTPSSLSFNCSFIHYEIRDILVRAVAMLPMVVDGVFFESLIGESGQKSGGREREHSVFGKEFPFDLKDLVLC